MNTPDNELLAIIADVFSLYNVTEDSFNIKSAERFRLNDWNFLTDALLKRLSNSYPDINPDYANFYHRTYVIPVGNMSTKEAKAKIDELIKIYNEEYTGHIPKIKYENFFVEVNSNYVNVWFDNIIKIEVSSCVPTIIVDKINKNTIHFNFENYGEIYKFIVENRKNFSKLYPEIYETVKHYINFLYGALSNEDSIIRSTVRSSEIVESFNKITSKIFEEFKHYVIAIDTDDIYITSYNVIDDIVSVLNAKYNFNLHVQDGYRGMFLAKKKHVLLFDDDVVLKGIKRYK